MNPQSNFLKKIFVISQILFTTRFHDLINNVKYKNQKESFLISLSNFIGSLLDNKPRNLAKDPDGVSKPLLVLDVSYFR